RHASRRSLMDVSRGRASAPTGSPARTASPEPAKMSDPSASSSRRRVSAASQIDVRRPLSRAWGSTVLVVLLAVIFAADHATGSAPVQHLYYLPIIFA